MSIKYVNMADITRDPSVSRRPGPTRPGADAEPAAQSGSDLVTHVELLFFAYRDFTADPDAVLDQYAFGRAHHRVLHFVHRNPGLRVANLLEILKITKQSLARVLKQLIGEGFIVQKAGAEDRRERLLALQVRRVETALKAAGPEAEAATRQFLLAMISDADRAQVEALVRMPADGTGGSEENSP